MKTSSNLPPARGGVYALVPRQAGKTKANALNALTDFEKERSRILSENLLALAIASEEWYSRFMGGTTFETPDPERFYMEGSPGSVNKNTLSYQHSKFVSIEIMHHNATPYHKWRRYKVTFSYKLPGNEDITFAGQWTLPQVTFQRNLKGTVEEILSGAILRDLEDHPELLGLIKNLDSFKEAVAYLEKNPHKQASSLVHKGDTPKEQWLYYGARKMMGHEEGVFA